MICTLKYICAAHTLTYYSYTSSLRKQPLRAPRASSCLVVMVTNGSSDDIFKPTYCNLQNPRFSAKTSIRNLSLLLFYKSVNGKNNQHTVIMMSHSNQHNIFIVNSSYQQALTYLFSSSLKRVKSWKVTYLKRTFLKCWNYQDYYTMMCEILMLCLAHSIIQCHAIHCDDNIVDVYSQCTY